ncbi:GbsR/MarR family transcriptional regulator [Dyadobacter sp. OTU695]|uniref:GbsR/MarR family transcriptional regulator n=1 Tax=Dyadobacter sp. OTU695 TaxID=3043860 RepID=UPI00313D1B39
MEQHRERIERHSAPLEHMGLTPVAARIFTYLLLTGKEGAIFEDLVAYFKVSKSAVSNALKMLTASGMAGYRTVGGKRRRFFYVNMRSMFNETEMTARYQQFFTILDDVRKARGVQDEFDKELGEIAVLYRMLLVEFPIILERWKRTIELGG